jgi:hypothetical protein
MLTSDAYVCVCDLCGACNHNGNHTTHMRHVQAAKAGVPFAQHNLAAMYLRGEGVVGDTLSARWPHFRGFHAKPTVCCVW